MTVILIAVFMLWVCCYAMKDSWNIKRDAFAEDQLDDPEMNRINSQIELTLGKFYKEKG